MNQMNLGNNLVAIVQDGATPLHVAASLGSDEIVKLMLASGVNIDELDENDK